MMYVVKRTIQVRDDRCEGRRPPRRGSIAKLKPREFLNVRVGRTYIQQAVSLRICVE